jgi:sugar phosphate isomerase/epimerase
MNPTRLPADVATSLAPLPKSAITISLVPEAKGGPFVLWDELPKSVALAKELGFDAVEIFPPGPDAIPSATVGRLVADHGLNVAAVGTGGGWVRHRWSLVDPSPAIRDSAMDFLRRILDVAASLGAPAILGSMQGRSCAEVPPDQAKAWLRSALERLDAHAAAIGGGLLYEPLNRYETDQCNRLADGVSLIDGLSRTRLLADWFHMNIEEADMASSLVAAGRAVGHIHFADTNRRAVGFGHLDLPPLARGLREIAYDGYLSAEVFSLPDPRTAAEQTMRAYQQFIAWMRS